MLSNPINLESFPGRTIEAAGSSWLYFGGTAYLGLQGDEAFKEIYIRNICRYGTSYGASRQSNVRFPVYDEAESELAYRSGGEAAILLSSGYLAGQLVCQSLKDSGCKLVYVPGTHPALSVEKLNTVVSNEGDWEHSVARGLESGKPVALLLDSIDFRGRHFPDFTRLKQLPLDKLILVVDDSHGFGVIGTNGEGALEVLRGLGAKELIVCGSLNKGYSIQAGVALGTRDRVRQFRETAFFAGASPPAPASVATFLDARALYLDKHRLLQRNVNSFMSRVQLNQYFEYNSGHAAFSIVNDALVERLEKRGILVTHFRYPNRNGSMVSRLVISAAHTTSDIEALAEAVNACGSD